MAISQPLNDAIFLLQSMDLLEACRIVANDVDLNHFLDDHRLELGPEERFELKSMFRA